jgi:hypothetical protein
MRLTAYFGLFREMPASIQKCRSFVRMIPGAFKSRTCRAEFPGYRPPLPIVDIG